MKANADIISFYGANSNNFALRKRSSHFGSAENKNRVRRNSHCTKKEALH